MKKTWIIVGFIALIVVGGGLVWLIINQTTSVTPGSSTTGSNNSTSSSSASAEATDMTSSAEVAVSIKNLAFQPASIKIKKGTKVTWTNQDSMGHAVVADDAGNVAGLPTTNSLMSKGDTYSFTFNTIGIITYHCSAHPSTMAGTIEVVE